MDYIPVYEGEQDDGNAVKVSPGKLQRTGVKTELVGKLPITQTIKAPGVVAFDETRLSVVAMRFDGFINKVMPVTSGTHVKKGRPADDGVRPRAAQRRRAQFIVEEVTGWKGPDPTKRELRRLAATRAHGWLAPAADLENLQVPNEVIEEIKRSRRVPDAVTWIAPQDGIVTERNAVDGQAFKAGDVLFRLADHSVVWVMADMPEGDVGSVRPGQAVTVRSKRLPGAGVQGKSGVRLSASDEGNAHGAGAHRAAQPRPGTPARHVRRRRDCHGLRRASGGGADKLSDRQR